MPVQQHQLQLNNYQHEMPPSLNSNDLETVEFHAPNLEANPLTQGLLLTYSFP